MWKKGFDDVVLQEDAVDAIGRTCKKQRRFGENGNKRKLLLNMRKKRLRFLEHVMRKEGLEN